MQESRIIVLAEERIVHILWTGGLDSSCRIAELSRQDVIVQPYYILDQTRGSVREELKAISTITNIIRGDVNTVCDLKDVIVIGKNEIKNDKSITDAWISFHEKYKLGVQYDWLARFAKQKSLILELCLENCPRGKATKVLKSESRLIQGEADNYMIESCQSSTNARILFENLRFPSTLWGMTKVDEVEEIKRMGLEEVVKHTWFCHHPIFGLTCGHCNPCQDALHEGMAWRLSKVGFVLGGLRKVIIKTRRYIKILRK